MEEDIFGEFESTPRRAVVSEPANTVDGFTDFATARPPSRVLRRP